MNQILAWFRHSLIYSLLLVSTTTPVRSQIIPDNTLGAENSSLTPNVVINGADADRIDGGAQRGSNLFHSFSRFNINDGQRVYFANPLGIQNIFTRVTGGEGSNILGTLGVEGTANLFLINPNGILFGKDARLDVRGSFVGTTANAVRFGETLFSATNPEAPPLLTINPSALFFTQLNPGTIINQSQAPAGINPEGNNTTGLRVPDGQSLLLVGGNINMDGGGLRAYSGRVELASLAAPGNVGLNVAGNTLSLDIPGDVQRGDISLTNEAGVSVFGSGGGDIVLNARNVEMSNNSLLVGGIAEGTNSLGARAGDIRINATESITMTNSNVFNDVRGVGNGGNVFIQALRDVTLSNADIFSNVESKGIGNSGNINIRASSLTLRDSAQLQTSAKKADEPIAAIQRNAGDVNIDVQGAVTITGTINDFPSAIFSSLGTGATGRGGNIKIKSGSFTLSDGAQLVAGTSGQGNAGDVNIDVSGTVTITGRKDGFSSAISSNLETGATGRGGNISIKSGSFTLSDGAELSASTFGEGDAGSVFIQASNDVALTNATIFSTVESGGIGNSGDISIQARTLTLNESAQLQTAVKQAEDSTQLPAGQGNAGNVNIDVSGDVTITGRKDDLSSAIFSRLGTGATGRGGNINIKSSSFTLSDGALLNASTSGKGDAGGIFIQASGDVLLANGDIFSNVGSRGIGNGGDISIKAGTLTLKDGAQLLTSVTEADGTQSVAGQRNAGNVNIDVSGAVTITGRKDNFSSAIFSSLGTGATGTGGNINIKASSFTLSNGARLNVSTSGKGDAGSVLIQASNDVVLTNATILSNVRGGSMGNGGNIEIVAKTVSLEDNSSLFASTSGQGNSGNISLKVADNVSVARQSVINTNVSEEAEGNAGVIDIQAGLVSLIDDSFISSSNLGGQGASGNILINTKNNFVIRDGSFLSADTNGQGDAGQVVIRAGGDVLITGRSERLTSAVSSVVGQTGSGNAGNIEIHARNFSLSNGANLVNYSSGNGNAGNIYIFTENNVNIIDSQIASYINGQGNAGKITIRSGDTISISGQSFLVNSIAEKAVGNGADLEIESRNFYLFDGAQLFTITVSDGRAGSVSIKTTEDITLKNGAQIRADTGGNGNAGNVTLIAGGTVFLDGTTTSPDRPTGISTEATKEPGFVGRGKAGDINITAGNLSINRAILTAGNSGEGTVGDININTRSIQLDNEGKIFAESNLGNGGNVNITASDFLLLRRGSSISTTAGKANLEGDGGNITINTPFIIAVPNENSDIAANAFTGRGGNVNINARNIFGIQARPKPTSASDITASSELGVQGQVAIAQPEVQSTQKLIELPNEVIDASSQVAQICPKGINASSLSQFIITGRGSLPPNPLEPLVGTPDLSRLATLDGDDSANTRAWKPKEVETMTDFNTPTEIIEAQSLVKTADGSVMLVASAPEPTPSSINFPVQSQTACSSRNLDKAHHIQSNH
ncbi:hypothetical protein NUACC21_53200 [Scytonema sp. NUACC21]